MPRSGDIETENRTSDMVTSEYLRVALESNLTFNFVPTLPVTF